MTPNLTREDKLAILKWMDPDWSTKIWDEDVAWDFYTEFDDGELAQAMSELEITPCTD